jgi:homocysteine S-methyltransferase
MARDCAAVFAVGVNCTEPADVDALVRLAVSIGAKPVVAYPNSGETWDARTRSWTGERSYTPDASAGWIAAGARLVGGCCRVRPEDIAQLGSGPAR